MRRAAFGGCVALLALPGCSLGGDEEPQPARGAPKAVASVIQELDEATRRRDFRRICNDLFTAAARRRAGGEDCERLLRSAARDVREPRIQIAGIEIEGRRRAVVRVRSTARGQRPLLDEIVLVRERGRYRIASLAG